MSSKPEPQLATSLIIRVFGMGADGRPFFQNVKAHDLTGDGALLSGLEHQLTAGDTIGVQLAEKKARCRVIWAVDGGPLQKIQVGVQLLEGQACPWKEHLNATPAAAPATPAQSAGFNKRRFVRHKIRFPLELREDRSAAPMQTSATDISGRGCYVETLLPLAFGTNVKISFWMDEEKIATTGIVRTSDPGVGMGIEFTGLDLPTQQRLQGLLEKMDPGSGFAGGAKPGSGAGN
jgi:hypothetical protein